MDLTLSPVRLTIGIQVGAGFGNCIRAMTKQSMSINRAAGKLVTFALLFEASVDVTHPPVVVTSIASLTTGVEAENVDVMTLDGTAMRFSKSSSRAFIRAKSSAVGDGRSRSE